MELIDFVIIFFALAIGGGASYFFAASKFKSEAENVDEKARKIISEAESHAREVEKQSLSIREKAHAEVEKARGEADAIHAKSEKILADAKAEEKEIRQRLTENENRLAEKEKNLDAKTDAIESKKAELEKNEAEIEKVREETEAIRDEQKGKLEEVAKLSRDEAKQQLLDEVEKDASEEILKKVQSAEKRAKDEADREANKIIASAIQRLSQEVTSESTVTLVPLPSDDLKGKIIGREGRNITAFEMATGVDVIVDDTPGAVLISGFDLLRRFVAKTALEKLVSDGRIQPARIEEVVKKSQKEADKLMQEWGEKAVVEAGVVGLPAEIVKLLGRLRFRTSYGQNVLQHSMETCFLAGALAEQLGMDPKVAKKAGLLHDLGKAVDHEIEGTHAAIGANILRKFKLPEDIIHAVEAHHEEIPCESLLDIIVQVADAISASRPGARRDSLEAYIQRLQDLENIASGFEGVENSFAISAGRDVRVIVNPEKVDDVKAVKLAKEIANKIESEMTYPGEIKVNVIRETRAEGVAK